MTVVDLHREVSLALLKSSGLLAIRTPRGQKDPGHFGWDPKTNDTLKSDKTIYELERNSDNVGIHLHGKIVDVDVDTDNFQLVEALEIFLPFTPHVWGRGDRKRTHRLYEVAQIGNVQFNASDYPFLSTIAARDDLKVEIRGGDLKNGQYSLLPGSLHPSGDVYEWDNPSAARVSPVATELTRVTNAVRFACVTALIAPHWTEGNRNNMCMALSGFLHRAASHLQDVPSNSGMVFDKADAEAILRAIMQVAEDDPSDEQMRIRTFEKTWDKADNGEPVSGATTIQKLTGDEDIVRLLYMLLADTSSLMAFDEFMGRFALRRNTSVVIDLDALGDRRIKNMMTVGDFHNSYAHKVIENAGGRVKMSHALMNSARAIRIDGMTLDPRTNERIVTEEGKKFVNEWTGYAIPPCDEDVTDDDVRPFLDYVWEVLAYEQEAHFNWVVGFIADMFQKPWRKIGTALILVGKPGAGKSMLGDKFLRPIIGMNHSTQTNTLESVLGKFNVDSAAKLYVQCDEATNSRRKADALRFKSHITDPTRRVEPKGVDAYELPDFARYVLTSNEFNEAVAILDGDEDRRNCVIGVNNAYSYSSTDRTEEEKAKFWERIYGWAEKGLNEPNKENLAKVHKWLLQYKYDEKYIRKPLDTEERRNLFQHSQRGLDDWLMILATFEHPLENLKRPEQVTEESYVRDERGLWKPTLSEWPEALSYRRLEDSYEQYRRRKGIVATSSSYNAQQIKNEFVARGLLPKDAASYRVTCGEWGYNGSGEYVETQKRIRITEFPSHEKITNFLKRKFGFNIDKLSGEFRLGEQPMDNDF